MWRPRTQGQSRGKEGALGWAQMWKGRGRAVWEPFKGLLWHGTAPVMRWGCPPPSPGPAGLQASAFQSPGGRSACRGSAAPG